MLQSAGSSSGHAVSSPFEAIVVMRIPTVALIKGDGSPTAERHSCLMNSVTTGRNLWKCAFTLFFSIRPLKDLVGSSVTVHKKVKQ